MIQFRLLGALMVFLGSYLPLGIILLIQDIQFSKSSIPSCLKLWHVNCNLPSILNHPWYSLPIFLVCLFCLVLSIYLMKKTKPDIPIDIIQAKYIPAELMSYTLPYVVSFMSLDYQQTGKFLGLVVFLLWMFWVTYRSGQIIMNPVFVAFGWRLYEVEYKFPGNDERCIGQAFAQGRSVPRGRYMQVSVQDIMVIKKILLGGELE